MIRTSVRDSDVIALSERVSRGSYQKYLKKVVLAKVRGFEDREVTFDFPVTALVGPNGGGKTTILGAAGIIYRQVPPGRFFSKSGRYDQSMQDWRIEYELVDRDLQRTSVQRTASFKQLKWNRTAVQRDVVIFGVARTVPANERRELIKAVGSKFAAKSSVDLTSPVIAAAQAILGKPMEGYSRLSVDIKGKVTLYSARTPEGTYSEFHFGAGEASIIRIISGIEDAPDDSLVLIEEIENGLHPVATRKMVEYLVDAAKRKSLQIIFTTHSNEALAPLPSNAIWAAYSGEVLQGKLDVTALRTITGQVDAALAIYVEDDFGELVIAAALRQAKGVALDAVKIHGMGGFGSAIKVNEQRNLDPARTFPSVAVVDGDQSKLVDPAARVYALPGDTYPEAHVFEYVHSHLDAFAAKLAVMLGFTVSEQEYVKAAVREVALTNKDRHYVFEQIGERLSFTAALVVKSAFISLWAQESGEALAIVEPFLDLLPTEGHGPTDSRRGS